MPCKTTKEQKLTHTVEHLPWSTKHPFPFLRCTSAALKLGIFSHSVKLSTSLTPPLRDSHESQDTVNYGHLQVMKYRMVGHTLNEKLGKDELILTQRSRSKLRSAMIKQIADFGFITLQKPAALAVCLCCNSSGWSAPQS